MLIQGYGKFRDGVRCGGDIIDACRGDRQEVRVG